MPPDATNPPQQLEAPKLCFGTVRHARLRPVSHAFSYAVYFLRLPLRAMARSPFTSFSALLSHNRFNLLSFHDADHGDGVTPALQWIEALLAREGIEGADGEIWLQTFPRVLGYVFNPVSFWFCHRADGSLRAVLCEVNNTFGERHCYLLEPDPERGEGAAMEARKVFHVSPFCPVSGHYRFRFLRTGQQLGTHTMESMVARIDYDDSDGPLIHTSISGTAAPLGNRSVMRAFFGYPLMTAMVMVRIHWHALRLWIKRVRYFRKPLPPITDLSR